LADLYKSFTQELNAYTELKGVNILTIFGHCIQNTPDSFNLMIITEFMSKGSLKSVVSVSRVLGRMDFGYFNTRNYQ
jgi:hypothetical protein